MQITNRAEAAWLKAHRPEWADTTPTIELSAIEHATKEAERAIDALDLGDLAEEAAGLLLPLLRQGDAAGAGVVLLAAFNDLALARAERSLDIRQPHVSDPIVAGALALARRDAA